MARVSVVRSRRKHVEMLKSKGVCIQCGIKPALEDKTQCTFCQTRQNERKSKKKRKMWKVQKVI